MTNEEARALSDRYKNMEDTYDRVREFLSTLVGQLLLHAISLGYEEGFTALIDASTKSMVIRELDTVLEAKNVGDALEGLVAKSKEWLDHFSLKKLAGVFSDVYECTGKIHYEIAVCEYMTEEYFKIYARKLKIRCNMQVTSRHQPKDIMLLLLMANTKPKKPYPVGTCVLGEAEKQMEVFNAHLKNFDKYLPQNWSQREIFEYNRRFSVKTRIPQPISTDRLNMTSFTDMAYLLKALSDIL